MSIAGVDEVGRGPLAGPVISCAVILPSEYNLPRLNDSKRLAAKVREDLAVQIKQQSLAWAIGEATVQEIDQLNILQATMLAMQRAVQQLSIKPKHVLIDGNRCPELDCPATAIVGGDGIEPVISAASIVAKVWRDQIMRNYAKTYPEYGFERNSGYPTQQHKQALQLHGVTAIHRRSFSPVASLLQSRS